MKDTPDPGTIAGPNGQMARPAQLRDFQHDSGGANISILLALDASHDRRRGLVR